MAEWMTPDEVRERWRDAPANEDYLLEVMDTAKVQVLTYGPAAIAVAIAADPAAVPESYRLAHLVQTRNLWNAVKSDPMNQGIGDEGFIIRPFPMDWTVKNMVRPLSAKPVVA
jgi:hypothetical protein